jgi:hypothetical protein
MQGPWTRTCWGTASSVRYDPKVVVYLVVVSVKEMAPSMMEMGARVPELENEMTPVMARVLVHRCSRAFIDRSS